MRFSCFIQYFFTIISIFLLFTTFGCSSNNRPRVRLGAYFGAPLGIEYPDPNHLGKHGYTSCWGERIGLVYTCKGGFVDLGHLRDSADRTKYCTQVVYANLIKGNSEFEFRLMEPSTFSVQVKYPQYWEDMTDREEIARDISIKLGKYLAYNSMVWHEIITWYGYRYTYLFSEYISSFSWEDVYSDIVGVEIAGKALVDDSKDYESKMEQLIYDELHTLDVKPVCVAKKAEKKVKGKWYNGIIYPFTKLKKRNMDIGIDDGYVTPWLIPGICENSESVSYPVPDLDFLGEYGFSVKVRIHPEIFEKNKILKLVSPDGNDKYVEPQKDFPVIMKDIINKEIKRNGSKVNVPEL